MLAIQNATLVMRDHLVPDGTLLIKDGRIIAVGEASAVSVPEGCERLDAGGLFAGPGLIDMHTHAAGGKYFYEDPVHCAREVLLHGVTGVLPALPQEYIQRFAVGYQHILHIDQHRPWTEPAVGSLVERVQPVYLTHELSAVSWAGRYRAVEGQMHILQGTLQRL